MTPIRLIQLLVSAILLLFLVAMLIPEPMLAHGDSHEKFPSAMQRGGDGSRHFTTYWFGAGIAVLQILLFVTLLSLGLRRTADTRRGLLAAGFVYLVCTLGMLVTYQLQVPTGPLSGPSIFLGLPVATSWMVYGVGLAPLLFMILYMVKFNTWVLTPEDESRLAEIVAGNKEVTEEILS